MKLILLTTPRFFVEEDKIITDLFEEGLDILHLRKPGEEPVFSERLLKLIPKPYRSHIVTHEHFYLKEEFQLKGIHLSKYNNTIPSGYSGHKSETTHSLAQLKELKKQNNYVILSPIYDSISRSDYRSAFSNAELRQASRDGLIDKKVMALGGISIEHISELKDLGFGGIILSGDIWSRFNIHHAADYRELIEHFRLVRKATE